MDLPEGWKVENEEDPYLPKEWNIQETLIYNPQPQPHKFEKVIYIYKTEIYSWSKLKMQISQQP